MAGAEKFYHPYEPYDIQLQFMRALYDCIEQGKIGVFESPTGTGKSLSLACGSLTWLRDHKRKEFDESIASIEGDDDEPEWMVQHSREEKKNQVIQKRAELETKLERIRQHERKIRDRQENGPPLAKKRKLDDDSSKDADILDDEQFALDDYESDDEGTKTLTANNGNTELGLSKETQALMQKLGYGISVLPKAEDMEAEDELKIYFCSRTHSQLSQFVNELRRIDLPAAIPAIQEEIKKKPTLSEELKHLSLGSRKNLCINAKVSSLKSMTAVNERCLELQDAKTPKEKKCPFVPNKENEGSVLDFQHHALAKIRDIEDLGVLGKKLSVCPYYATRPAVKPSEIVTLPYPLLLQKTAREALGLSLKNHIVIIDEAHNLMDAISGIHTVEVSLQQFHLARAQLTTYLQRFRNRLKGKNRVYITQVVRLLDSISSFLQSLDAKKGAEGVLQATDLLKGKGVDQINLYKLMHYLQESKLARKVEGYVSVEQQKQQKLDSSGSTKEVTVLVLTHITNLFMVLTNPAKEGRLFYTVGEEKTQTKVKYMLLDPSEHFRDIVEEARAVILAGGTMSPMSDYMTQLFPYLDKTRITTLSCGHVIPTTNLFVSPVVSSHNNTDFTFSFSSRNLASTMTALGDSILRLLPSIPHGCVAFFPSYSYLEQVVSHWQSTGLWAKMQKAKTILKETQQTGTEEVLAAYTTAVHSSPRGAFLLAVIGGRLSEGINFSDSLGRCVMVIGLPYANPNTAEQKAKTAYVAEKAIAAHGAAAGATAARDFADNTCMRAVNQAIGRAVRHKNDWSAILLFDGRYTQKRIQDRLPGWIKASLREGSGRGFGEVEKGLKEFYARRMAG
ncbi:ATP-dependent RNA helicase chl1 [Aureobasidium namibiae CBS 147.97]|uniref:ATP-dependent DNA helicase CHL1 n=1 Tax=Aureobasidium namibiae CBS 147.97 TaxID=1043004 RepID=A0A074WK20_9PEZI|nr:ATP-dependent RNA helicase chl1 [Aureobasidium namibiae CBS 147.97]KEQ70137.1 ATP-dependent RNA helicase chl1 [Aureobasidium namibiae CBS 147.97]